MTTIIVSTPNRAHVASLTRAATTLGHEIELVKPEELAAHNRFVACRVAAIVYEPIRPGDGQLALLRSLRRTQPHVPIILLLPTYRDRMSLAGRGLDVPKTFIHVIAPDSSGDDGIETELRIALARAPGGEAVHLVTSLLGKRCPLALAYTSTVIQLLPNHAARDQTFAVDAIASQMPSSPRTLSRHLRDAELPAPLLFLDGLMLVWVACTAWHGEQDARDICRRFSISEQRMVRTLRTLTGLTKFPPPGQLYVEAVVGFARLCGVNREAALEVIQGAV